MRRAPPGAAGAIAHRATRGRALPSGWAACAPHARGAAPAQGSDTRHAASHRNGTAIAEYGHLHAAGCPLMNKLDLLRRALAALFSARFIELQRAARRR
ncbi:hypothetical protein [Burkholderia dolosa]|uniref:hypothetical protein n=1 Tax=Burkholderia dolosa TaxID=152500 RepID=UPI001B95737C|nr:hypothetical protein [Burkholderia dolosa]MBR8060444.1 hypothetical protein [Burkholderia dolosa]